MNLIISFSVAFCFAIAFVNGVPDSAENCACSNENENDDLIVKNVDEAENISLKEEWQANDKPNQGCLGSILAHLGSLLESLLSAILTGYLNLVASLPEGLAAALKGLSKKGLIGLLGGLARKLNEIFRTTTAKSIISGLTGSDSKENVQIKSKVNEALQRSLDDLTSGCKNEDGDLNDVLELLAFALKSVVSIVVPFLTKTLGSTVGGLLKGLSTKPCGKGLVGRLLGLVEETVHGLTAGTLEALIDYLKSVLP